MSAGRCGRRRVAELESTAAAYARANVALSLHAHYIQDAADSERQTYNSQIKHYKAEMAAAAAAVSVVAAVAEATVPMSVPTAVRPSSVRLCVASQTESPPPRSSVGAVTAKSTADVGTQSLPEPPASPSIAARDDTKNNTADQSAESSETADSLRLRLDFADNRISRLSCELSVYRCDVDRLTAALTRERRSAAESRAAAECSAAELSAARSQLSECASAVRRVADCDSAVRDAKSSAAKYRRKYTEARARLADDTFRYEEAAAALTLANKQIDILKAEAAAAQRRANKTRGKQTEVSDDADERSAVDRVGAILTGISASDEANATSLSCPICYKLIDDAVAMTKCGHIGCRACIAANDVRALW